MNEYVRKSTCTKCASSDLLEGFTMMEKNVKKQQSKAKQKKTNKELGAYGTSNLLCTGFIKYNTFYTFLSLRTLGVFIYIFKHQVRECWF